MSSNFYTSVIQHGNNILLRGVENNKKIKQKIPFKPYVFINSKIGNSPYRTLDGKVVDRLEFASINEAKEFVKKYEGIDSMPIYSPGSNVQLFIFDNYREKINYNPEEISVLNFDIEVDTKDGMPNIELANKKITTITIEHNDKYWVFGYNDYTVKKSNHHYTKCRDEKELLMKFLEKWQEIDPDVLTGWNINQFDIPYVLKRMRLVLSNEFANKLSPWGIIKERTFKGQFGRDQTEYEILGITSLDYIDLYKKFTYAKQESYSLDYICLVELGEQKIDYSEYGDLNGLYQNNFELYVDYNIRDVELVKKLDNKLKLIELVYAMAYDALTPFADTFTSVRFWETIINNHLLEKNIVPPIRKHFSGEGDTLVGAYVKDPKIGMSKWIVSFDLNSLYPSLIMQYNISPETFVRKLHGSVTIDDILNGEITDIITNLKDENQTITANLCLFDKDRRGFLPELMDKMYNDRVIFKKKMNQARVELKLVEEELKKRGISL